MDKQTRAEIAKRLREIADLIEGSTSAPATIFESVQIGGCSCHRHVKGQLTGGWLCPVHGRQF